MGERWSVWLRIVALCSVLVVVGSPGGLAVENSPPTISVEVADFYCRGDYLEIDFQASDPDGDPIVFGLSPANGPLPQGLRFVKRSGVIKGILEHSPEEGSSTGYDVSVVASDPGGLTATADINIFSIACEEPRISRFVLVDPLSDLDLRTLKDGDAIRRNLAIRVDAYPESPEESFYGGIVQSVEFVLDGSIVKHDRSAPYAVGVEIAGDFRPLRLTVGSHVLVATAFDAAGNPGETQTIHLTVRP